MLYPQSIFRDVICLLFKAVLIIGFGKYPPSLMYCKNDLVHNVICSLEEKHQSTPACFLLLNPNPATSSRQEGLTRVQSGDGTSTTPRSSEAILCAMPHMHHGCDVKTSWLLSWAKCQAETFRKKIQTQQHKLVWGLSYFCQVHVNM